MKGRVCGGGGNLRDPCEHLDVRGGMVRNNSRPSERQTAGHRHTEFFFVKFLKSGLVVPGCPFEFLQRLGYLLLGDIHDANFQILAGLGVIDQISKPRQEPSRALKSSWWRMRLICSESLRSISAMMASMVLIALSETNVEAAKACSAKVCTASFTALFASEVLGLNSLFSNDSNSVSSAVPAAGWRLCCLFFWHSGVCLLPGLWFRTPALRVSAQPRAISATLDLAAVSQSNLQLSPCHPCKSGDLPIACARRAAY